MSPRRFIHWLVFLVLLGTLGSPREPSEHTPIVPSVVAAAVAPLGWGAIERRIRRGVRQGVRSFHFELADLEDVTAIAMERIWRAFISTVEPIRHPEAWARTIAERVALDEVRRQRRERARLPLLEAEHSPDRPDAQPASLVDPLLGAAQAERRELLQRRVQSWPAAERRLAEILLGGEADTITAAAWLYRSEQEARGEAGTMYPQKARLLLEARRGELRDLI